MLRQWLDSLAIQEARNNAEHFCMRSLQQRCRICLWLPAEQRDDHLQRCWGQHRTELTRLWLLVSGEVSDVLDASFAESLSGLTFPNVQKCISDNKIPPIMQRTVLLHTVEELP